MGTTIIAACDGAAKGNPGPAGWAWVLADEDGSVARWESGALGHSTNNVGELTALLRLLEATDPDMSLEVRMDSTYAMQAVTSWLPGWRRRGWKTASGSPVANKELIVRIDEQLTGRDVRFVHVRAHQVGGDPYNAVADQAASDAARTQTAAGTAYGSPMPDPAAGGDTEAAGPRTRKAAGKRRAATVKAKFPGRCRCGRSYAAGESIAKNPDGWGHPDCRTAANGAA
jgi:ribonuclease HI